MKKTEELNSVDYYRIKNNYKNSSNLIEKIRIELELEDDETGFEIAKLYVYESYENRACNKITKIVKRFRFAILSILCFVFMELFHGDLLFNDRNESDLARIIVTLLVGEIALSLIYLPLYCLNSKNEGHKHTVDRINYDMFKYLRDN